MSPLAYCDNNFIVAAHDGPSEYKTHLSSLAPKGVVTLVLSPWHWREMATDADHARGTSMADFCDSLNAEWLYDRRSVQKKEVAAAFYRFAKVPSDAPVMTGDIGDIVLDMIGTRAHRKCRAFVEHLRQTVSDHPLEFGGLSESPVIALREQKLLRPQLLNRISQLRRLLELEPFRGFAHVAFEFDDIRI